MAFISSMLIGCNDSRASSKYKFSSRSLQATRFLSWGRKLQTSWRESLHFPFLLPPRNTAEILLVFFFTLFVLSLVRWDRFTDETKHKLADSRIINRGGHDSNAVSRNYRGKQSINFLIIDFQLSVTEEMRIALSVRNILTEEQYDLNGLFSR